MKKLFTSVLLLVLPIAIFASPFGLKKGMTLDEITKACDGIEPEYVEGDIYYIKPIKSHLLFKEYIAYVNEKVGLYQVRAISDSISTNKYGTEIKNAFNEIKDRIAKTYGTPKVIDEIRPDSIWKKDEYWFSALRDGARTLAAIWGGNTKNLPDDLELIALECKTRVSLYDDLGILVLYYYFNNTNNVKDEQDSVF